MPQAFACFSPADPDRIWSALTDAAQTPAYLYGLAAHSTWTPDAPIELRHNGFALRGRVVCSRRNERLSYLLQSDPDDPPVYLTWLIRPRAGGCTIRLEIDEVDFADGTQEAEDTWLPVLAALQTVLAQT